MPMQGVQQRKKRKRKKAISPELREVLKMLKSLEAELGQRLRPAG
jgi:hypothetical protein